MKKILAVAVALVLLIGLIPAATMMNAAAADTWVLVTDASTLKAGDQLVLACNSKSMVSGAFAGSKYFSNVSATFSADKSTVTLPANAVTFTLGGSAGAWTLTESATSKLVGTSAKNALKLGSGTTTWTIAIASKNATITSTNTSYGCIQFNASSPRFCNYTSNQTAIQLYRLESTGGDPDISDGTTTTTTTTTKPPVADGTILFDFGANSSSTNVDGTEFTTAKTFDSTDGTYQLTITPVTKVYSGAYDALGNSCIKLGTGSKNGSFSVTVPDGVNAIVFYVAKYKANTTKISVNGTEHTISTSSNDGAYTPISVDTTTNKTVTFATVGTAYRCLIDSIAYVTGGATVPTTPPTEAPTIYQTPAEIVAAAEALAHDEVLSDGHVYTLTGVITQVDSAYSTEFGNVTVTMEVTGTDGKTMQCFRMKGEGADQIGTGDTITVSGMIKKFNSIIEFDAGCTLDAWEDTGKEAIIYETPAEIMDAAYALETGATLSDGHAYTLTGVITAVNFAYSESYGSASVTILVNGTDKELYCYKLAGEGADKVKVGDTITATGSIKNYNGKVEFDGCTLDSYVPLPVPTITDLKINTDSAFYDEETKTFFLGKEEPLVITLIGENFNLLADIPYEESNLLLVFPEVYQPIAIEDFGGYAVIVSDTEIQMTLAYESIEHELETYIGALGYSNNSGETEVDSGYFLDVIYYPSFTGRDLTLSDDLDVGFHLNIPEDYNADDMKVVFEVEGKTTEAPVVADADGKYVIHLEVPAKDMTTPITAKLVDSLGVEYAVIYTTVSEYCEDILNDYVTGVTPEDQAVAEAMLNYGAMAQLYFDHNTDTLANGGYETDLNAADVSAVAPLSISGNADTFLGASLVLKSKTIVRLYFSEAVEGAKQNTNGWYVDVEGIGAGDLNTMQTVTVGEATFNFSVLSFAKTVIEGAYDADFQNLMKALVLYSAAVEDM